MIRFATFNIGGGVPEKNALSQMSEPFNFIEYITSLITKNQIDVVCFQEVLIGDEMNPSMSCMISEKCDLKYYKELMLSDSHIVHGRKMGVSILSKYPIVDSEVFMLENPNITCISKSGSLYVSHEKGFLITKVLTDEGEICCVTGHCIPYHSFKRDSLEFIRIFSKLEDRLLDLLDSNSHVLIGADFNTTKLSVLMPKVFQRCKSIVSGPTRPNGRNDDYILFDQGSSNGEFELIETCFDHYGCMGIY